MGGGLFFSIRLLVAGGGGLLCLVLGVWLLVRGLRGRRLDEHPVCRKCRFDLDGVFPGKDVCPECGSGLKTGRAVRIGNRRRRRGAVGFGSVLLLLGLAGIGAGSNWGARVQWIRLKPTWLLLIDARGADAPAASTALKELTRRVSAGSFSEHRIATLAEEGLALQANQDAPWTPGWGDLVEAAHGAGEVAEEDWAAYLRRCVTVSFAARPRQHVGGDLYYEFVVAPARAGEDSDFLAVLEETEVRIGDVRLDSEAFGRNFFSARAPSSSFGRSGSVAELPPGTYTLRASYAVGIGPGEGWEDSETKTVTTVRGETSIDIELVPPEVELVGLISDEEELEAVKALMRAGPIRISPAGQSMLRVNTSVMFGPRDYTMAFDVFVRDETGREWPLNSGSVIAPGLGGSGFGAGTFVDAPFEPARLDLVLRASPRAAEKDPSVTKILGGEIVIPNVEIDREDPQ